MARRKKPFGADFRDDVPEENGMPDLEDERICAAPKSSGGKSGDKKQQPTGTKNENNRVASVLLFAAGVLVALIILIQGSAGWHVMHEALLGLFGVGVFGVPVVLIVTSLLLGSEKSRDDVTGRAGWGFGLTILFSSIMQLFIVGKIPGHGFIGSIVEVYKQGTQLKGGGVLGMPVAWAMLKLCGGLGAKIVVVMLFFVLLLLLTGKGIVEFFQFCLKPFGFVGKCLDGLHTMIMGGDFEEAFDEDEDEYSGEDDMDPAPLPPPLPEPEPDPERRDFDADLEALEIVNSNRRRKRSAPKPEPELTAEEDEFSRMFDIPIPGGEPEPEPKPAVKKAAPKPKPEPEPEPEPESEQDIDLDKLIDRAAGKRNAPREEEPEIDPEKSVQLPLYILPGLELLHASDVSSNSAAAAAEMREKADTIVNTLKSFNVEVRIVNIYRGPSITRYEIQPGMGVRVKSIINLENDIALNLAAKGVRIEAPVPGKQAIGIEVPNTNTDTVTLREILASPEFRNAKSKLTVAIGKDVTGKVIVGDISKLPHAIIAGTTGSGKSICTKSMIMSILFKAKPDEVKLILIDPKVVEFKLFENIPHLLIPIVTEKERAPGALLWAVNEMEHRYKLFAELNVTDIRSYNELSEKNEDVEFLPQVVIFIDEMADLMMVAGKDVEDYICRLAQKSRAAGMHLILATQRPSAEVITGLITSNVPSRIALSVKSGINSRIILDENGAEKLLGKGDMLYMPIGMSNPMRVQGCFTSDMEIRETVEFVRSQGQVQFDQEALSMVDSYTPKTKGSSGGDGGGSSDSGVEPGSDEEYILRGAEVAVNMGQLSTTMLQKRLKLGYARASRIMDELEDRGIIGPPEGSKPRKVLMSKMQFDEWKMRMLDEE